jgi:putative PEP-CTERM system TPR-repeat lipoprotein
MLQTTLKTSTLALMLALSGCATESLEDLYTKASSYSKNLDFKSSIVALKKAAILDTDNVKTRKLLGIAYLNDGQFQSAEKEFEIAHLLDRSNSHVTSLLAKVKFELRKYSDVYALSFNEFTDKQDDLSTTFYAALASIQENKKSKLATYVKALVKIDSASAYTTTAQAWGALVEKDITDATELVKKTIDKHPQFGPALFLAARLHDIKGEPSQAIKLYNAYLQINPNDTDKKVYIFQNYLSLGDLKNAEIIINDIYAKYPKHPLLNLYKAQVAYEKGEFTQASQLSKNVLATLDNHINAKLIAGTSAYMLGKYTEAYNYLSKYENDLSNNEVKHMLSLIKLRLGKTSEVADSMINEIENDNIDIDLLLATSGLLNRKGQAKKALELLERATKIKPKDASLIAQQGLYRLSEGDSIGIDFLEKSIALDDQLEGAKLALAMAYLRSNDIQGAQEIAIKWGDKPETQLLSQLLKASIHMVKGEAKEAKGIYNRILKERPKHIATLYSLSKIEFLEGDIDSALSHLKQTIKYYPSHIEAINDFTEYHLENKSLNLAIEFIKPIFVKNNNNIKLRLGLANLYLLNKAPKESINLLESMSIDSNTPDFYWIILGDSYVSQGLTAMSISAFERLVKRNPSNYLGNLRYIAALRISNQYSSALQAVQNAKAKFKHDEQLILLHIDLLNKMGQYTKSLEIISMLSDNKQKNIRFIKLAAIANIQINNADKASQLFLKAYEIDNSTFTLIGAVKALMMLGDNTKANRLVEKHHTVVGTSYETMSIQAEINTKLNPTKALAIYEKLIRSYPKNFILFNNAANLAIETNYLKKALIYGEQSYRIKGNQPAILNTYGVALIKNGKYDEGAKVIEKAIKLGSQHIDSRIELSVAYEKTGAYQKQINILESTLKIKGITEKQIEIINSKLARV